MTCKTLLFDLDGTLLDTLDDLAAGVNHCLEHCGFEKRTREEVSSFIGSGVPTLIRRSLPSGSGDDIYIKAMDIFTRYYSANMSTHTKPFDGIYEMLSAFKNDGFSIAIVSNKKNEATVELCSRMLSPHYDFAIGATGEHDRKPSPAMVHKALGHFNAPRESAVYIGDSDIDIFTAKNAGIKSISVLWGYRSREELKKAGAESFAETTGELYSIISKNTF